MGFKKRRVPLEELLIKEKILTQDQLEKAASYKEGSHKKITEILVDMGYATEEQLLPVISRYLGIETVELITKKIPDEIISLCNGNLLRKHIMIPFALSPQDSNVLYVAMADPMNITSADDMAIITNMQIEPFLASSSDIQKALDKYYGNSEALSAAEKYSKERELMQQAAGEDSDEKNEVSSSPIVQLVKSIIEQAARQRASDIHIEALENKVRVRYRIDGALYEKMSYDIQLLPAIIARIKIIGGMDISEKRKPQDGRITILVDRKEIDIRVSILPTVFGEKVVMRLAQKKALTRDKSELGFNKEELQKFDNILRNPHGIILVTGPTGSGKSTTLYTALSQLNKEDVNIITVEDPVEANIDGINQVQVNTKASLTFANALRSILRQDPDIIMIGEIRDSETASIAVQASITGHLVVSTLHTNSAAGSIMRLIDMGIESYLIADSTVGVIAQRLVRRLCPHCKGLRKATDYEKKLLQLSKEQEVTVYEPKGCELCNDTGYYGRIGVYEIMEITAKLRRLIAEKANAEDIKEQALRDGMRTLRMSASKLVVEGITSITEMVRISFDE